MMPGVVDWKWAVTCVQATSENLNLNLTTARTPESQAWSMGVLRYTPMNGPHAPPASKSNTATVTGMGLVEGEVVGEGDDGVTLRLSLRALV